MNEMIFTSIIDSIENYHKKCFDKELSADDFIVLSDGENLDFDLIQDQAIKPTDIAKTQFLNKIKVPTAFFNRCPQQLQQAILNNFHKERDYLLRCVNSEKRGTFCRAVLSSIYTKNYDNHIVFPIVLKSLKDIDVKLRQFINDETITRVEFLLDSSTVNYENKTITPGLMITNSETGHSSLWMEPIVVIDNDLILASRYHIYKEFKQFRQIHKGNGLNQEEIEDALKRAIEVAQIGVVQYMESLNKIIKKEKAIDFVKSIDAFPKRFVNILESEWNIEEELKQERVFRDILTAAKELPILSKIMVEQSVGKWYGIFKDHSKRMEKIIENVQQLGGINE